MEPSITVAFEDAVRSLESGRLDEAVAALEALSKLEIPDPAILNNLGNAYLLMGQFELAVSRYVPALLLSPSSPQMLTNIGVAFMNLRMLNVAASFFSHAIKLDMEYPSARWNASLLALMNGDYGAGWAGYEWRWKLPRLAKMIPKTLPPRWNGQHLHGESVLVYFEQGFGDSLQFVRFVPRISEYGGRPTVVCQSELVKVLRSNSEFGSVYAAGDRVPRASYSIPMMSLPAALKVGGDIGMSTPYLHAEKEKVDIWRARLGPWDKPKVGIVWAGNSRADDVMANSVDKRRSVSLDLLRPLLEIPGITFVSLQKIGEGSYPQDVLGNFVEVGSQLEDFSDTAAVIECLDLTITVDTAVVHLCGALGRPVWMLSRHDACWRWLIDRADSPWYPSLRIFGQRTPADWHRVVEDVAIELRKRFSRADSS